MLSTTTLTLPPHYNYAIDTPPTKTSLQLRAWHGATFVCKPLIHIVMDKVTLFPMNRTESGNLVLQSFDDTTLNGTNLVFVDALRAQHFGLTDQVKSTWVECRDSEEMTYPEFCSKEAVALDGVKLVPYMDRESGEPWTTEDGKQWYGLVRT